MPVRDWGAQATWEASYVSMHGDTYGELYRQSQSDPATGVSMWDERWARLFTGWTDIGGAFFPALLSADTSSQRFLVAGSGLGFLVQAARDAGFPNVWGIDFSGWCEAHPDRVQGVTVWAPMKGTGQVRNFLRQLTQTLAQWASLAPDHTWVDVETWETA